MRAMPAAASSAAWRAPARSWASSSFKRAMAAWASVCSRARSSACWWMCSACAAASACDCSAFALACASSSCKRATRFSASALARATRSSASRVVSSRQTSASAWKEASAVAASARAAFEAHLGLVLDVIDPRLGGAQLVRQREGERGRAVAVLVRHLGGFPQLGQGFGVGRIVGLAYERRVGLDGLIGLDGLELTHDCRCPATHVPPGGAECRLPIIVENFSGRGKKVEGAAWCPAAARGERPSTATKGDDNKWALFFAKSLESSERSDRERAGTLVGTSAPKQKWTRQYNE